MAIKRSLSDFIDELANPNANDPSEPRTPKKTKTSSHSSTPNVSPSSTLSLSGSKSAKAKYAEMIIEAGVKALSKGQVEQATGLTADQQKGLVRRGKGSVRGALEAAAAGL